MTLLADRLAQRRLQVARVNDGKVRTSRLFATQPAFDVKLARSVAALAADRVAMEDGLLIMVDRVLGDCTRQPS